MALIQSNRQRGFTLIELLVTLVIAALLASLATPSFQDAIRSNRVTTSANSLLAAINLARSEAINRGQTITIRHFGTTDGVWDEGWFTFVDYNSDGVLDDNGDVLLCEDGEDCLIKLFNDLPTNFTLRSNANFNTYLSYLSSGLVSAGGAGNGTFRLCDDSEDTTKSRSIVINTIGRAYVKEGTDSCP
jgi:type IV fimbrial biogenesis protein FimT